MFNARNSRGMVLLHSDGQTETWGNGYWHHPMVIRNVLCEDGIRRTVRLNQDADTYFSWSGRTSFGKVTVRGTVTHDVDRGEPIFTVYKTEIAKLAGVVK